MFEFKVKPFISGVPNPRAVDRPVRNGAAQQEVSGRRVKLHLPSPSLPIARIAA